MEKKILMIGNFPTPITGVTILNEIIYQEWSKIYEVKKIKMNTSDRIENENFQGKLTFKKVIISLVQMVAGAKDILNSKFNYLYMVPGESYFGAIRFLPFILMAKIMNKKKIFHIHGEVFYQTLEKNQNNKIFMWMMNNLDRIIVLSEKNKKMLESYEFKDKVSVCINGIPDKKIVPYSLVEKKIKGYDQNKIKVLYLSNVLKEKGILDLIEAVKLLKKEIDITLDIAGNIEPRIKETFENELKNLKCIKYHGIARGEEKYKLLEEANIFCLPTYLPSEAIPLSILEAMQYGCAIVTTNQGSIGEIFKEKINGETCIAQNIESIKKAILKTNLNYKIYSQNNYKRAIENYTLEIFLKRLENLIFSYNK